MIILCHKEALALNLGALAKTAPTLAILAANAF
jgi:hypothetical protein